MVDAAAGGARLAFATQVLQADGLPVTSGTLAAMLAWMQGESGYANRPDTGLYNPLNISHDVPGHPAASTNGNNTRNYASWDAGVAATAASLHESNFRGILNAFQTQPNNPGAIVAAIQSSPWAGGHYGGRLGSILSSVQANPTPFANGWVRGPGGPATPVGAGGSSIDIQDASSPLDLGLPAPLNLGALSDFWSKVFGKASGLSGLPGAIGQVAAAVGQVGTVLGFVGRAFAWGTNPHNWGRLIVGAFATGAIVAGVVMIAADIAPATVKGRAGGLVKKGAEMAAAAAVAA